MKRYVKGTLPSEDSPGTFRCSRKRCFTCPFISSRTLVEGPKSTFQVKEHFDCTSSNIIYCIHCSVCNLLYFGETGRCLGDHFRDHLYNICKQDLTKPVSRHFNSHNHSESDIIVLGLISSSGDNESRKTIEMRLIHSLGTVNPHGINERFAFHWLYFTFIFLTYCNFDPFVLLVFTLSVFWLVTLFFNLYLYATSLFSFSYYSDEGLTSETSVLFFSTTWCINLSLYLQLIM